MKSKLIYLVCFLVLASVPSTASQLLSEQTSIGISGGCNHSCSYKSGSCWTGCKFWYECRGDGEKFCTAHSWKYKCKDNKPVVYKNVCEEHNQDNYCGEIRTEGGCNWDIGIADHCEGGDWVSDKCPGTYTNPGDGC